MYKKILIPVDGSEHSQEAVRIGIEFAKQLKAQIVFTYAQGAYSIFNNHGYTRV